MKKLLALALTAMMLVSLVPATALAREAVTVTYNLLDSPVTVGTAERPFEEDGSYTIELENDAFFPYEVQFTLDGVSESRWFMTPDDTVTVGGHEFRVVSGVSDPSALTQIGITVSGEYVPVYPEAKEFTDNQGIEPMSMLPIEEHKYTVDLKRFLPAELGAVNLTTIFSSVLQEENSEIDGKTVVFAKDDYSLGGIDAKDFIILSGQTVDLRPENEFSRTVYFELIVGSGDQLDPNNVRYVVSANIMSGYIDDLFELQAYFDGENGRTNALNEEYRLLEFYSSDGSGRIDYVETNLAKEDIYSGKLYIGLSYGDSPVGERDDLTVEFYPGYYSSGKAAEEAGAEKIPEIWNENIATAGGYPFYDESWSDHDNYYSYRDYVKVTAVFRDKATGEEIQSLPLGIRMEEAYVSIASRGLIYAEQEGSSYRRNIGYKYEYDYSEFDKYTIELEEGYPADGEYYYYVTLIRNGQTVQPENVKDYVIKSVAADVDTLEGAAQFEDITEALFSYANGSYDGGYKADFSEGITFTIFYSELGAQTEGPYKISKFAIQTVEYSEPTDGNTIPSAPTPASEDTYFQMRGANGYNAYQMPYDADAYYYNGYQTIFLLTTDNKAVADETEIVPHFYTGNNVTIFLGHDKYSGEKQESDKSPVKFKSGEALLYSAAAENTRNLKNYWVTFLTQQDGAKLFVNGINDPTRTDAETGIPEREVLLTGTYGFKHDIFIANIGNEALTGIKVELKDAENVKLDDYWTVREGSTATLAPFETTFSEFTEGENHKHAIYGQLQNVAKIRLLPIPDSKGEIKGTLVITTDNGGTQEIKLTGRSRMPQIITEDINNGVKYVHYSSLIQTNNMYEENTVQFELDPDAEGSLPNGLVVRPNGEIYGVPTEAGEFKFTVRAYYTKDKSQYDTCEYTLIIADSTKENVEEQTTTGYELTERVPDMVTTLNQKFEFHSNGALSEFMNIYKDGVQLVEGTDYTKREGSTVISIFDQTIGRDNDGEHVISAEFRTGGSDDGVMSIAAQTYTLALSGGDEDIPSQPEQPTQPTQPAKPSQPDAVFSDVDKGDWFYDDVIWAQKEGILNGTGNGKYEPNNMMSWSMFVTVLARIANVDLTAYTEGQSDIPAGHWYTAAALWAREKGLLPGTFTPDKPIKRGEAAVILASFIKNVMGDKTDATGVTDFPDADKMTSEELASFKFLYAQGIFKGVDETGRMNPSGTATRATLATLAHRVVDYIKKIK